MPSPESFLPLKPHWFHVLLSLADQEQHGYGIMQEVLDRTEGKVGAPLLLGVLVACYVPASNAMRMDAAAAPRQE